MCGLTWCSTKCKSLIATIQVIYCGICRCEQSACHMVYWRTWIPVCWTPQSLKSTIFAFGNMLFLPFAFVSTYMYMKAGRGHTSITIARSVRSKNWYKRPRSRRHFIMSSSTSAWLLRPLECSPQKQNSWTLRFCFWGWTMWKMYNKTITEFGFRMISWIIKTSFLCYLPKPKTQTSVLIIHDIMLNLIQ